MKRKLLGAAMCAPLVVTCFAAFAFSAETVSLHLLTFMASACFSTVLACYGVLVWGGGK